MGKEGVRHRAGKRCLGGCRPRLHRQGDGLAAADCLTGDRLAIDRLAADRPADQAVSPATSTTFRPMYVPQFGQTTCDGVAVLHVGQYWSCSGFLASCARRLPVRAFDCLRLGTAMTFTRGQADRPNLNQGNGLQTITNSAS